jgi:hypothetical protein
VIAELMTFSMYRGSLFYVRAVSMSHAFMVTSEKATYLRNLKFLFREKAAYGGEVHIPT